MPRQLGNSAVGLVVLGNCNLVTMATGKQIPFISDISHGKELEMCKNVMAGMTSSLPQFWWKMDSERSERRGSIGLSTSCVGQKPTRIKLGEMGKAVSHVMTLGIKYEGPPAPV